MQDNGIAAARVLYFVVSLMAELMNQKSQAYQIWYGVRPQS